LEIGRRMESCPTDFHPVAVRGAPWKTQARMPGKNAWQECLTAMSVGYQEDTPVAFNQLPRTLASRWRGTPRAVPLVRAHKAFVALFLADPVSILERATGPGLMNILVVDDSPIFRDVLQRMLTGWGYEVSVACDGAQAWDRLQAENAPRLVVLDWMMPGMDGIELCRRIRGCDRSGPYIIMLTAKTEPSDLLVAIESGADDYVSKPLKSAELRTRLRTGCRILELQQSPASSIHHDRPFIYRGRVLNDSSSSATQERLQSL
jgi:CheY-like chemotaxis protein